MLLGLLLTGCYDSPVSNSVFLEDAIFLAALPSEERLLPPPQIADAELGDAVLLRTAVDAERQYLELMAPVMESAMQLRRSTPMDRSEVHRTWQPVPVVVISPTPRTWWVRATILAPADDAISWTIDVAPGQDGPWTGAGSGWHDGLNGGFSWDRRSLGDSGLLNIDYALDASWGRDVYIEYNSFGVAGEAPLWGLHGDDVMSFTDERLELTGDGDSWPSASVVYVGPDGGRADGHLWQDGEQQVYTECWDGEGDRTYIGGDSAIENSGSASACTGADVFGEPPA